MQALSSAGAIISMVRPQHRTALAVLASIETAVGSLDPDIYFDFLAGYAIYKSALEDETLQIFTVSEVEARLGLAQEEFEYFPGSELVALYYVPSG